MATAPKPTSPDRVSCSVCMKEVPRSEAVVPEAVDTVLHFCGLDCFDHWQRHDRRQDSEDIRRAVDDGMHDLRMRKTD